MVRLRVVAMIATGTAALARAEVVLPAGSAPKPVDVPHFPDRVHAFVWRNWSLVDPERMADLLGSSVDNVTALAASMGLPPAAPISPEQKVRGYITVLKRNWHLLPYEQLLAVLDMTPEQLAERLREDDFLYQKLGSLKPACPPLRYSPPDDAARARAAEIRRVVSEVFGRELTEPGEPRFAFVRELGRPLDSATPTSARSGKERFSLRLIYSYFALYGDPLMNPELDPFPEGLLQRLAGLGINGVWMHTVLRDLAPSPIFPEYGKAADVRLANLRRLVERTARHGIRIYLYINEPRAMPESFFAGRPEMKGVREGDYVALCTSVPVVRQWLADSLTHVFREVPGLGGVFTITASENLTNCASHYRSKECVRCRDRRPADIIAEVNAAIEAGVHRAAAEARVIVWDWGWPDEIAPDIIAALPKSVWLSSVSEWSLPITRGGVSTTVGEYSLSAVGPGPRATRHWRLARAAGLKTVAKMQINNTWECSAVPYLPVLDLVAEHCRRVAAESVDGLMLSWTLGGYPSPNLAVVQGFLQDPPPDPQAILEAVAQARYGPSAAPWARRAWKEFSEAFREYPYHGGVLYNAPVQVGPANLLHPRATGYASTMVGFPYDHVDGWRSVYPADVFASQFEKVADGWDRGLELLRRAVDAARPERRAEAQADLRLAAAAGLHFRSVAHQVRFTMLRDELAAGASKLPEEVRKRQIERARGIARAEIEVARELFRLARDDSRIGYEASNHYYYVPLDLVEKVINCRYILDHWPEGTE